jgi:hypothetical protein
MEKEYRHPLDKDLHENIRDAERVKPAITIVDVLKGVASLRLTVFLFVLSLILVFCGTIAQVDLGNWTVVNRYFRTFYVWIPFQTFVHFFKVFSLKFDTFTIGIPSSAEVPGTFPFPGGWTIGCLLLVNLLAAHAVRFRATWKKSGVLILHAGLILLMASEVITGKCAVEGSMPILTGTSSTFVNEKDSLELAVVEHSDAEADEVTVVPLSFLKGGQTVKHDALPFAVEMIQFMPNSELLNADSTTKDNPATQGIGLRAKAIGAPENNGMGDKVDLPSAYMTFKEKGTGKLLGTYLLSFGLKDQEVEVGENKFAVSIRPKRIYKPYTIHLKKFEHDVYPGTNKPRHYSSTVQLVDPTRGEDREVVIWMNHPLRFGGEVFYQSGVLPNDSGTILQVVRNPGWILPYVSCAIVAIGMLLHFGMKLSDYLRLRGRK